MSISLTTTPSVSSSLKDAKRLVSVDRLEGLEPGIFDEVGHIHAEERFVLDDQDERHFHTK